MKTQFEDLIKKTFSAVNKRNIDIANSAMNHKVKLSK
jgi:hypothetical protein